MSAAAASADAPPSPTLAPPDTSSSLTGKRKRPNTVANAADDANVARGEDIYELVGDLFEVLASAYPFASTIFSRDIPTSNPSTKRTKRSNTATDVTRTSIKAQVDSKAYQTFEELADDLDKAVDAIVADLEGSKGLNGVSSTEGPSISAARSFQAEVHSLLDVHSANGARAPLSEVANNVEKGEAGISTVSPHGRSVLTLFGHSGQGPPRQYFASLKDVSGKEDDAGVDPMATATLPNGIFTTCVLPPRRTASSKPKPKRLLKDVLPPPPSAYPYKPPIAPPSRATRSSVVEWYRPASEPPKTRPGDKEIFVEQTLTHGQWLSYLSHADQDETISEKRLKRDRALSGSEGPDESELEFLQQQRNSRARAKKRSLFRSTFSSFGPSWDDSNAIVPAETRSHLWWNKIGKDIYNDYVTDSDSIPVDPELTPTNDTASVDVMPVEEQTQIFKDAVEAYVDAAATEETEKKSRKDEDEMLEEITDAIEALLVYQQERHKVMPVAGRAGASQQPSAAEQAIYEVMEAQLMLILSQLPPHVVTRLNGDKLGKLNVRTVIPISVPTYSGIIDEPDKPAVPPPSTPAPAGQPRPISAAQQSSARLIYPQTANTPPTRPAAPAPRSAAATTSQYGNRSQPAAQYGYQSQTVQQPSRQYQHQQQATSQMANGGYRPQVQNGYQQYGQYAGQAAGSPAVRPPHPNQYTNRQQQGYQPRPGTYPANAARVTSPATGRSASPQNPSSYSAVQNRATYGVPQSQQATSGQNGQHASSYPRPTSGNNMNAAQSSFAVGGVKFSDEELAAINQRRQLQNSPPLPQTTVGQRPPSANGVAIHAQAPQAPMQAPVNGA